MFAEIVISIWAFTCKDQLARFIIHLNCDGILASISVYDTNCFALVINFDIPNPAVDIISASALHGFGIGKKGIGVVVQEIWRQFDHGEGFL
jgi:hypothetical protein